jgi:hypothetical protein
MALRRTVNKIKGKKDTLKNLADKEFDQINEKGEYDEMGTPIIPSLEISKRNISTKKVMKKMTTKL